jgi:threonine efflux protein
MASSLLAIAILHWSVLLIPGFNFLLIGQLAAAGKHTAAMAAVAGMTVATLMWALLAVAGVGLVFTAHPSLRLLAQIAGGIYLIYLAWKMWRAAQTSASDAALVLLPFAAFRAGFVTSALNPKIALFYGSVFATALPANPPGTLVFLAVMLVFVNSAVWHSSLAFALSMPAIQSAYLRHSRLVSKVSGLMVAGMGLKLIISTLQEARSHGAS